MKRLHLSDDTQYIWQTNFDFSMHSSVRCGGKADICYYPNSVAQISELVEGLTKEGIAYFVLGNLTNVLPADEDFNGAVISTKRLSGVEVGERTFVYAGTTAGSLLAEAKRHGKTGGEFLYGVPCTLGGALYMNAGAGGKYISEIVDDVLVLRNGEKRLLPVKACEYSYKHSAFMENGDVILGAYLRLTDATPTEIEEKKRFYLDRRAHLPKGHSMGCVFKNPEGQSAGELIEKSGLKGLRMGGAKISEEHANFILNEGGATAREIRSLITLMKNAVYSQYGVRLEEEIRYL